MHDEPGTYILTYLHTFLRETRANYGQTQRVKAQKGGKDLYSAKERASLGTAAPIGGRPSSGQAMIT